jgi:hypothetical protein
MIGDESSGWDGSLFFAKFVVTAGREFVHAVVNDVCGQAMGVGSVHVRNTVIDERRRVKWQ